MFERKRYLREVIETKSRQIAKRDSLIAELRKENQQYKEENKDLRFENEEFRDLVKRLKIITESNNYNNKDVIIAKIKELVCDYQSEN